MPSAARHRAWRVPGVTGWGRPVRQGGVVHVPVKETTPPIPGHGNGPLSTDCRHRRPDCIASGMAARQGRDGGFPDWRLDAQRRSPGPLGGQNPQFFVPPDDEQPELDLRGSELIEPISDDMGLFLSSRRGIERRCPRTPPLSRFLSFLRRSGYRRGLASGCRWGNPHIPSWRWLANCSRTSRSRTAG